MEKEISCLLVRPLLSNKQAYGKFASLASAEIPNGLISLGTCLERAGYSVKLLDATHLNMSNEKAADYICSLRPKVLGISVVTPAIDNACEIAGIVKRKLPEIKIIIGGPHITALGEETIRSFPQFDIGAYGEGEITIVSLLDSIIKKAFPLDEVKGILFRNGADLIKTPSQGLIRDLDTIPQPNWELLADITAYHPPAHIFYKGNSILLITSRGCPYQCIFCDRSAFGRTYRCMSAEYIYHMVKALYDKYGIRFIRINDDNFILNKGRVKKFCQRIIEGGLKITWAIFTRADTVDLEFLKLMKKAGCIQISFGIESSNTKILKNIKKNADPKIMARTLRMCHEVGIKSMAFLIFGSPGETAETMRESVRFCFKNKASDIKIMFMSLLPNTEIHLRRDEFGKWLVNDFKDSNAFERPTFIPNGLTAEEMLAARKWGYRYFYLRPRTMFDYLKRIKSFSQLKSLLKGAFVLSGEQIR